MAFNETTSSKDRECRRECRRRYIAVPIMTIKEGECMIGFQAVLWKENLYEVLKNIAEFIYRTKGWVRVLKAYMDVHRGCTHLILILSYPEGSINASEAEKELEETLLKAGASEVERMNRVGRLLLPRRLELSSGYNEVIFTMDEDDLVNFCRSILDKFGVGLSSYLVELIGEAWGKAACNKLISFSGKDTCDMKDIECYIRALNAMKGMGVVEKLELEKGFVRLVTRENSLYRIALSTEKPREVSRLVASLIEGYLRGFFTEALKSEVEVLEVKSEVRGHKENVYIIKKK